MKYFFYFLLLWNGVLYAADPPIPAPKPTPKDPASDPLRRPATMSSGPGNNPTSPVTTSPLIIDSSRGATTPPPPFTRPAPPSGAGAGPTTAVPRKIFLAPPSQEDPNFDRQPIFRKRGEINYRSLALPKPPRVDSGDTVNNFEEERKDLVMTIRNHQKEAENDMLVSKFQYESDLKMVDINKRLHAQIAKLYEQKTISLQEFKLSLTKVLRSEWRTQESKYRVDEFQAEVEIDEIRLRQLAGEHLPPTELAQAFVRLWEARILKYQGSVGQAQVDNDYLAFSFALVKTLQKKNAASEQETIRAQRDAEESNVILELAKNLLEQTKKFYDEAVEAAQSAGESAIHRPAIAQ